MSKDNEVIDLQLGQLAGRHAVQSAVVDNSALRGHLTVSVTITGVPEEQMPTEWTDEAGAVLKRVPGTNRYEGRPANGE